MLYIVKKITETRPKKHFKNEQRSRDAATKKRANTSGVGKINNHCEDIYIPLYHPPPVTYLQYRVAGTWKVGIDGVMKSLSPNTKVR